MPIVAKDSVNSPMGVMLQEMARASRGYEHEASFTLKDIRRLIIDSLRLITNVDDDSIYEAVDHATNYGYVKQRNGVYRLTQSGLNRGNELIEEPDEVKVGVTRDTATGILLVAMHNIGKKEIDESDIVIESWRLCQKRFGLLGYNTIYPDANRVRVELVRSKPLMKLGYIERVGKRKYRVTPRGHFVAKALVHKRRG